MAVDWSSSEQSFIDSAYWTAQTPRPTGCNIREDKVVLGYYKTSTVIGFKAGIWDGSTWTWGAEKTITAASVDYGAFSIASFEDDAKFMVSYYTASGWAAVVGNVASSTITFGAAKYHQTTSLTTIGLSTLLRIDTNKFVVLNGQKISTTSYAMAQQVLSVTSTTISTSGSPNYAISFGSNTTGMNSVFRGILLDTNTWCWAYHQNSTSNLVLTNKYTASGYTISSTTMSSPSISDLPSSTSIQGNCDVVGFDTNSIICAYKSNSSGGIVGRIITAGSSSYTWGAEQDLAGDSSDIADLQWIILEKKSTSLFRFIYNFQTDYYRKERDLTISGSTISAGSSITYSNAVSNAYSGLITVSSTDSIFLYRDYSSPYYLKYAMLVEATAYEQTYTGSGTVTASSDFAYEWEESGKSYTAEGTITTTADFIIESDITESLDINLVLSSAFDYDYGCETAINGTIQITSSTTHEYIEGIAFLYTGSGLIEIDATSDIDVSFDRDVTGTVVLSSTTASYLSMDALADGLINTSSNFITSESFVYVEQTNGLISLSGNATTDLYYGFIYSGSGTVGLSSSPVINLGVSRITTGKATFSNSIVLELSVNETSTGMISLSGTFDYSNRPMYVKTVSGVVNISASNTYYYYDFGPVDVYWNGAITESDRVDGTINESELFCQLSETKVLRLFTKGSTNNKALYGQFISIDENKNLSVSTKELIRSEGSYFTNFYSNSKLIKVRDDLVVFFWGPFSAIVAMRINQETNDCSTFNNYYITNSDLNAIYTLTDVQVFGTDRLVVLYNCDRPESGTSANRIANAVISGYTLSFGYQLNTLPTSSYFHMCKVREDAFIYSNASSSGIAQIENGVCVLYQSSIVVPDDRWTQLDSNKVIAPVNRYPNKYAIYTISGSTLSISSSYDLPFTSPEWFTKVDATMLEYISIELVGQEWNPPYTLNYYANSYHVMPNNSLQSEKQFIKSNAYGSLDIETILNRNSGLSSFTTNQINGEVDYVFMSYNNVNNYKHIGSGVIDLTATFDYAWYPDFIIPTEDVIIYASSDIIPEVGFEYICSGEGSFTSDNIYEVEYFIDVFGAGNFSSGSTYEESNNYEYNGNITGEISANFQVINYFDYLFDIYGTIVLRSEDECYPEIVRNINGNVVVVNIPVVQASYDPIFTGLIEVHSNFDYIVYSKDFLYNGEGLLKIISNTYSEANSFEYVINANIYSSSDFKVQLYYEYLATGSGSIKLDSNFAIEIDYTRNVNATIIVSIIAIPEVVFGYVADGLIKITGDVVYIVGSQDYLYMGTGLVTITSDFTVVNYFEYLSMLDGNITVTGYFPEEVTTYKYDITGMIVISSSTTHSWLADSKEVIKIESLIANTLPLESMIATKILVTGLVNKNNKLNARL